MCGDEVDKATTVGSLCVCLIIACGNMNGEHEIIPRTQEGCSGEGIELTFEERPSKVN